MVVGLDHIADRLAAVRNGKAGRPSGGGMGGEGERQEPS
jgi:hypothetical protein